MQQPFAIVALSASGLLASVTTTSAETITVCAKGCDHTSINAAIAVASDGDVIQLSAETYFEGEQINTLGKAITLRGVLGKDGEPASVLDGAGTHRVMLCEKGEGPGTVFDNLVIQNGFASGVAYPDNLGGGMMNIDANPTLSDCTFKSNSADGRGGGGMCNSGGSPTLTNCTFTNNSTDGRGGGMRNDYGGSPSLSNCTFTNNSAGNSGGGMWNDSAHPSLIDCIFIENAGGGGGGGMYNGGDSRPTLLRCRFERNVAAKGAGMNSCGGPTPRLEACVFVGNVSDFEGGGMSNCVGSAPILRNCTFRANNAGRRGGGIYNDSGGPTVLLRCTFESNVPDSITYAEKYDRPRVITIDPNVTGDLDGDGDYDATDVRLAMIEFGIVEAMPGSPEDDKDKSAP